MYIRRNIVFTLPTSISGHSVVCLWAEGRGGGRERGKRRRREGGGERVKRRGAEKRVKRKEEGYKNEYAKLVEQSR